MDPRTGPDWGRPGDVSDRDVGLGVVRRITRATAVGVVGGVAVLVGYVAHALPGRHVTVSSGGPSGTSVSTPGSAGAPAGGATSTNTGSGSASPPGAAPQTGGTALSPPPAPPQASSSPPQIVSGSS